MSIGIVFQKLETIKLAQTDPQQPTTGASGNLRVDIDDGGYRRIALGMRNGEQMGFGWSDDFMVPFDDHVTLTLTQDNNYGYERNLGSMTVPSSELNRGERAHHFTGSGADVVLTYFVKKLPCD